MSNASLLARIYITAGLLVGATVLLYAGNHPVKVIPGAKLETLPLVLGSWRGTDWPLTERTVEATGMDDYVNRGYTDDHANSLELYIGYHASQRSGELIHSPRNCLPAAGWEWARKGRLAIDFPGLARFEVNDFRIVKGLQQRVVLYWYQGRGRAIPGEYEAKFWTIADALIRHRTDGALVRIVTPIQTDEAAARAVSVSFLRTLCPCLQELIPN